MELLAALERLAPVVLLKRSFLAYPLVNAVHILAIGLVLSAVLLMDLRLLGAFRQIEADAFVALLRRVALAGFAFAAATGLALFAVKATDYAAMPVFLAKMALIGLAAINFAAMRRLAAPAPTAPTAPGVAVKASAALSIALWLGVLVCGRLIGFL